ncbi:MAG: S-layer homology domain-containing protein [Clostridiales bacterium]|nr:S-layer homology domain-containing protein [Clostridiales bacterium]
MKKLASFFLSLALLSTAAYAADLSDWAQEEFSLAGVNNLIPYSLMTEDLGGDITREELCEVIMRAYTSITNEEYIRAYSPFEDTDNEAVVAAYALGITEGTSDTTFSPAAGVSRQAMTKMLVSALCAAGCPVYMTDDESIISGYEDRSQMADWAVDYIKTAISTGIVYGTSDNRFSPLSPVTREQALIIAVRMLDTYGTAKDGSVPVIETPEDDEVKDGDVTISWSGINEANDYRLIIKSDDKLLKAFDLGGASSFTLSKSELGSGSYSAYVLANTGESEVYSLPVDFTIQGQTSVEPNANLTRAQKFERIFGSADNTYKTPEEARKHIVAVEVPVWKMKSDGSKYQSSLTLEVNEILAGEVKAIFEEIFNDSSQFPIYEGGGYSWRMTNATARSEHSYGTCIDLNVNENYQIKNGKILCGSLWKPYENPYSFPEDGIVVRTFAKYGWAWGGNAWRSSNDYMHFSYLGY